MKKGTQLKSFFCAITLLFSLQAKLQIITTVAGNGAGGYGGDGGLAIYANLNLPCDVKLDTHGNIYFSDNEAHVIRRVDAITGIITTIAGTGIPGYSGDGGQATNSKLVTPTGIAIDSVGNIYISDGTYRVRKVDAKTGIITTIAGTGYPGDEGDGGLATNARLWEPNRLALDISQSNLLIVDSHASRIRKVNLATGIISTIAGTGSDGYNGDGILATDAMLQTPVAIAVDTSNNIFVSDFFNYRIRKITASNGIITTVTGNGIAGYTVDGALATNSQIGSCYALAVDKKNDIYFYNQGWNYSIAKINASDGIVNIVAGNGDTEFNGDGILASDAAIGTSFGLAINDNGDIFTSDYTNHRVRKITIDSSLLNQIYGYAYYDLNSNKQRDNNENLFSGGKVVINKGADSILSMSSNSKFRIGVDTGNFIASFLPPNDYYKAVPATYPFVFTESNQSDSVFFALQPVAGIRDLFVNMYSLGSAVPGFGVTYMIQYENKGTDTVSNGYVQLIKDHRFDFVSSTPANGFISGDTIRWNYSSLKPLDTASILVYFDLPPTNASLGDTLHSLATINPVETDRTPNDDSSYVVQIVRGSFDPNDKAENHGGFIAQKDVLDGDYLTYTIRFQNTGTAHAINIVVKDTLDQKLDWNSLQMVSSSHNCQLLVTNGNNCVWTFSNILLPDSNTNESASHGYIVFRIKTKSSLKVGDVIKNTASIYFDYNAPVQTNTEKTKVVGDVVLPLQLISFTAKYNGSTNLLQWSTAQEINTDRFEVQRSSNSRDFVSIGTVRTTNNGKTKNDYSFIDALPLKGMNYYRLKIADKDGKFVYSAIKSLNVTGVAVTVYPNPVKNILMITGIEASTTRQVNVIDMKGNIVMKKLLVGNSLNVESLAAGIYHLYIEINGELQSVKFIKE